MLVLRHFSMVDHQTFRKALYSGFIDKNDTQMMKLWSCLTFWAKKGSKLAKNVKCAPGRTHVLGHNLAIFASISINLGSKFITETSTIYLDTLQKDSATGLGNIGPWRWWASNFKIWLQKLARKHSFFRKSHFFLQFLPRNRICNHRKLSPTFNSKLFDFEPRIAHC